jgi:glycosyltransferase involved in cell wall biosynthesis
MTAMPPALRVLNVFGRLERGGAELRSIELAEAFPPDRVRSDFLVLTGLEGVLDRRVRAAGGEVVKCRLGLRFPMHFYRLLRERQYHVVHSHVHFFSGVILALARLGGVPGRVAHLHTAIVNDRSDTPARRAQLAVCRALLDRNATDIVAVCEGAMDAAWEGWRADPRCRVIYGAFRPDRLSGVPARRSDTPTIVNVGSIKPLKNQLRLIGILRHVVAKVPGARLLLIGRDSGAYGRQIRLAAAEAGLADRVLFVGEVEEPLPWIARAQVMIVPSLWEGLPGAVLEACAVGTPAVVSDQPGTREIARYFPQVDLLSLDQTDERWAAVALAALGRGASSPADAAERLARSPFSFDRSADAHFELWSRAHATA